MKIVVVGATGNVGTSTLRALAKKPEVTEIVGVARRRPSIDVPKTRFTTADVVTDDLVPFFRGAHAVVHLAWLIQPRREEARLERVNVDGTRRLLAAVAEAGAPAVVVASSVGAYSVGPKDRPVDESWPTDGIATSLYSRQKAKVERLLDVFEAEQRGVRVVRMRPALVFKRDAASEIRRLFIGPFVPSFLFRRDRIPIVPDVERLRFQCVHSFDAGEAFALAATREVRGAFNVAAAPVLDPVVLADTLGAKRVRVPSELLRQGAQAAWRLRLTPSDVGWIDLALGTPVMDTTRARTELGWKPRHTSTEALLELLEGLRRKEGLDTVPLRA